MQQEVAQRRRRDTKPFRWTAIDFTLSDQKAGPQYVQAPETHLGQFPFDLTLHFQIELARHWICACRADMDETFYIQFPGSLCGFQNQIMIDGAERRFFLASFLPGRTQHTNQSRGPYRLDYFAPLGRFSHEKFHANTARQLHFAPRNAGQANILAPDALTDNRRADQPRCADQRDADRIRHCSVPQGHDRKCADTDRWHSDRSYPR